MAQQVNALSAFRDTYSTLDGLANDMATRKAGNALAQGDYGGAANIFRSRGMLDQANGIEDRQQQSADRQAQTEARGVQAQRDATTFDQGQEAHRRTSYVENLSYLAQAKDALQRLPLDQRAAYYHTVIKPQLLGMPGFDQHLLDGVDESRLDDASLNTFGDALEKQKLEVIQRGGGGYDVVDAGTKQVVRTVAPTIHEPPLAPGFRWTDDSHTQQEPIPGGPGDIGYRAKSASATRAPRRAGGGHGGVGGSLAHPQSKAEYDGLAPGTTYVGRDGVARVKQ